MYLTVHDVVVLLIIAGGYLLNPFLVVEIPFDGLYDAIGEPRLWIPSEFILYLCRVDSITLVVSETVCDMCDEVVVNPEMSISPFLS